VSLLHLYWIKKDIQYMTRQVQACQTEKKIDITYYAKDVENLAIEINTYIDHVMEMKIDKKRTEDILKKTITNMSHDLRTPLTSIMGYIQLLDKQPTVEEQQVYTQILKNRTQRLQQLLNEFFELSLIESPDYQLQIEKINMTQILWEVLMNYYDSFQEKKIEPSIHMPSHTIMVCTDQSAVVRVVENLVSNMLKYAEGTIDILFCEEETCVLFICKNKAGKMTEDDVKRIFDRFYTGDNTRMSKGT